MSSRYSVGIVHYRAYADLAQCLDSLAAQTLAPEQVVVVDVEPEPADRVGLPDAPPRIWLDSPNRGFAGGANLALRALVEGSEAEYLLVLNPDTVLELRTNKSRDDSSDLAAVADVVATASDEDYRDAIEELVDVDELLTYWAIEALTAHWDGYAFDLTAPGRVPPPAGPPGNPTSNNFYVYHDPETDLFVFIPHGADVAFGMGPGIDDDLAPSTQVLIAPKADATIATRLWVDPAFRDELAERIQWVLDEVWDVQALTERGDLLAALVRANGLTGSREFVTMAEFEDTLLDRKDFLTRRAEEVRAELASWESGDAQGEGN